MKWYFHYYGAQENHVREQADRFGLTDRIVLHGRVPRREALSAVKGANLAVVITSVYEQSPLEDKGIVPGKIFEAIGLGTPVLLIAPNGSDATAITRHHWISEKFYGSRDSGYGIVSQRCGLWTGSPAEKYRGLLVDDPL